MYGHNRTIFTVTCDRDWFLCHPYGCALYIAKWYRICMDITELFSLSLVIVIGFCVILTDVHCIAKWYRICMDITELFSLSLVIWKVISQLIPELIYIFPLCNIAVSWACSLSYSGNVTIYIFSGMSISYLNNVVRMHI